MKSAEQIKAEMAREVEEHNTRVAQDAALQIALELSGAADELCRWVRFNCRSLRREDVAALLERFAPYLALLAEVAPALPTRADAPASEEAA